MAMASAIEQYVRDAGGCGTSCKRAIIAYFDENPTYITKEIIVYRGQTVNDTIDPKTKNSFFSVSTDMDIAADFARGGYLFKIYLKPGVQYIQVGDVLSDNSMYGFENEFLIRGGGIFSYKSRHTSADEGYDIIEVEYTNIVGGAGAGSTNKNKNKNIRKTRTNKINKHKIHKSRKVSKKNIRKRAIDEGFPENLINNNILKNYLGINEEFET